MVKGGSSVAASPTDSISPSSVPAGKALSATRESHRIEFKEGFNPEQLGEVLELLKDVLALANSGGGCILFGVKNDGTPAGVDVAPVLAFDPARLTDQINKYTGVQFSDFEFHETQKQGMKLVAWVIGELDPPAPFSKTGNYARQDGKQVNAFLQGVIYFRHGAKSEPGTRADIRESIERAVKRQKKNWLSGIRKVVTAPRGHKVMVLPPDVTLSGAPDASPVRLTNDPSAPIVRRLNPDETHPYRRKDVLIQVNSRLTSGQRLGPNDFNDIRKVHGIDSKPELFYKSRFISPQYSLALVEWLMVQIQGDPDFISKARAAARAIDTSRP
ncbi:MAG: putative DNA binding domain-containing protein [Nitrososphaerota archaeon]|nr:putative DNA binding domain-containing protein [Nitrososphaerota archaeon]